MKTRDFLQQIDDAKVVAGIQAAERRTSGEIRVWITDRKATDVFEAAQHRFKKLRMDRTAARNGVLIYLAPRVQRFAVIGDEGIHARCGPRFWTAVAVEMEACLRAAEFTGAVVRAVEKIGALLAEHFPAAPDDRNELADEIGRD
jgi:uncharacterized membrane protein